MHRHTIISATLGAALALALTTGGTPLQALAAETQAAGDASVSTIAPSPTTAVAKTTDGSANADDGSTESPSANTDDATEKTADAKTTDGADSPTTDAGTTGAGAVDAGKDSVPADTTDAGKDSTTDSTTDTTTESSTASATTGETSATAQSSATVDTGLHTITSSLPTGKVVEAAGGGTSSGTAAQTWSSNNTIAQRWNIVSTADGTYKIVNVKSGLVLDVDSGVAASGRTVRLWTDNGTKAQRWLFSDAGSGLYKIVSALDGRLVLDISGGNPGDGGRLQLYVDNGTAAQAWALGAITQEVEDGFYRIGNEGSGSTLDVSAGSIENGGNVQQWSSNSTMAQTFQLTYNESTGYYRVLNANSGKALDVAGGSTDSGANVQQYAYNGSAAQMWSINRLANGAFVLMSAVNGKVLDVLGGSRTAGANVQVYDANGTAAQAWVLTNVTKWLPDGVYQLVSGNNHSNAVMVTGKSDSKGTDVVTAGREDDNWSEKWAIVEAGNGYYTIRNVSSRLALDVACGTAKAGTNVQQYDVNGTDSQLWKPVLGPEGITFVSKLASSLVLDISGGSTSTGASLQIWTSNGTVAQRFLAIGTDLIVSGTGFVVENVSTGKVLDVAGGSTDNGATVQLYASNNTTAQKFRLVSQGSGVYYLVSARSGKYLDVDTTTNEKIQQWAGPSGDSMRWTVTFDLANVAFTLKSGSTGRYLGSVSGQLALDTKTTGDDDLFRLKPTTIISGSTLNGIDIASWQEGIDLAAVPSDFVIVKATQGTSYTNPSFRTWADQTLAMGKKLGLYHFIDLGTTGGDAVGEANKFVDTVSDYIGSAVLVLDWETSADTNVDDYGASYAKAFLDQVYARCGVRAVIYMSQSVAKQDGWSGVSDTYKLWVANYGKDEATGYRDATTSGSLGSWDEATIFQYTSNGRLSGWDAGLDLNRFYGDAAAWDKLAARS
ncbi:MAG: RICIN domain-containing protein [Atopobiaceae bacterium]|nr:RICIN domain-containing protein [Atopobiaceae bacterium]MCI2173356.1 RICIN domain-containing protein [Atopobiaceae bacterium]MCI2207351.1 RICIN domain-containing protein [Atopobiaceae bacterium]